MKILFFGRLKEIVGLDVMEGEYFRTLSDLKNFLFNKYPDLKNEIFSIAVNFKIIHDDVPLNKEDEIALLPPISGG